MYAGSSGGIVVVVVVVVVVVSISSSSGALKQHEKGPGLRRTRLSGGGGGGGDGVSVDEGGADGADGTIGWFWTPPPVYFFIAFAAPAASVKTTLPFLPVLRLRASYSPFQSSPLSARMASTSNRKIEPSEGWPCRRTSNTDTVVVAPKRVACKPPPDLAVDPGTLKRSVCSQRTRTDETSSMIDLNALPHGCDAS